MLSILHAPTINATTEATYTYARVLPHLNRLSAQSFATAAGGAAGVASGNKVERIKQLTPLRTQTPKADCVRNVCTYSMLTRFAKVGWCLVNAVERIFLCSQKFY